MNIPFWWLFPVAFLLAVFYLYPALEVVRISFTDATLMVSTHKYTWIAIDPSSQTPLYLRYCWRPLSFVAGSVIGQTALGLLIALTLQAGFRGICPA